MAVRILCKQWDARHAVRVSRRIRCIARKHGLQVIGRIGREDRESTLIPQGAANRPITLQSADLEAAFYASGADFLKAVAERPPDCVVLDLQMPHMDGFEVQSRLADIGAEIFPRDQQTPEALGALVKADAAKLWPIIKEFGIRAG